MKNNIKKIIARSLMILGFGIIAVSYYTSYKVEKENKDIVAQYKKSINSEEKTKESTKINEDIVGILKIPTIDLEVAVEKGTDEETLKYAVGHFKDTALPGEDGNFAVAGHRNYTYNKFFSNLGEVSLGDEIKVITTEGTYTYIVNSTEIITPDKVEVLNSEENKKTITLVTCTPKYSGTHRLIIKGDLKV